MKKTDSLITDNNRNIEIRKARVNNLKGIDLSLPRGRFIVVTGLSGSGKSSLAFDTLFAEGQRRYVESLSTYARQFLGKMAKPECDSIKGLPPAIAIEQKVNTRNPRSTVGTSTEIYDYLRLLFARVGRTFSPVSGVEVRHHTIDDVVNAALQYPEGTRIAVVSPVILPEKRKVATQLDVLLKAGYTRLVRDGEFVDIADLLANNPDIDSLDGYMLLVDRLAVSKDEDEVSRLAGSVETAFFEGHDELSLLAWTCDAAGETVLERKDFSRRFEADGITFEEPDPQMFNFNNPYGACPRCEGFGKTIGIDPLRVVPNQALSVYDDAVVCWRGDKMGEWKKACIRQAADAGFPIHRPYNQLTEEQLEYLWNGTGAKGDFTGINGFFDMVDANQYKIQYRVMKARYRGKTVCPECKGHRLRRQTDYIRVAGKNITELVTMSVDDLSAWFDGLRGRLTPTEVKIADRLITEISSRLGFLADVGLGYLTLDRPAATLSGGESQRINLATSLGSALVGSLYILDEPSIGLHSRDTDRLIGVLRKLQQKGNTVVVVEHDEEIMRAADYIVDIGPDAGRLGGEVVLAGELKDFLDAKADDEVSKKSYTIRFLRGELTLPPSRNRKWNNYIEVKGASENNLKNIDVRIPLGVFSVVTGVSGSGKSTLVRNILYRALSRALNEDSVAETPGAHLALTGDIKLLSAVEMVDQNPIGRSTRSNPATYMKAYDEIRHLYSEQPLAKQMGFSPAYFSFNTEGGRCEQCKGEGFIEVEMQFMADIVVPCESCHGHRFKRDVLDVMYRGKNIYDVLELTVDEAIEFFSEMTDADAATVTILRRIVSRLQPLADVGLGYIKLGQSSATLSGGENQRVKLASFIAGERRKPTMFIFDEPTTGLHFHDIATLMRSLQRLVDEGHSVVVIEHNLDVIASADHVIDLGPEGGDAGGNVVATGTPADIAACKESYTGQFLAAKIGVKK